jgi:hypothetical protein
MKSLNTALNIEWNAGKITLNDWNVSLEKDKVDRPEFNMYKPEYDKYISDNFGSEFVPNSNSRSITTDLSTSVNNEGNGTAAA